MVLKFLGGTIRGKMSKKKPCRKWKQEEEEGEGGEGEGGGAEKHHSKTIDTYSWKDAPPPSNILR